MAQTDDYKIRVQMDRADAVAGAREVGEAIEGVTEKTEESEKGFGKLAEEASSMRESRKLAMDLFATMQGGGETVEGLTGLFRVLFATLVDVDPIVTAFVLIGGALTAALTRSNEREGAKDQLGEAKGATDDLKASTSDFDAVAKNAFSGWDAQIREGTQAIRDQISALRDLQHAKDELQNANMAKELADLGEQEEKDLAGKDSSQQGAIKRQYDQKELGIRQRYAQQAAQNELADKQQAAEEARAALQGNRGEAYAIEQNLGAAYSTVQGGAAAEAKASGLTSDAQRAADRLAQLQTLQYQMDATGSYRGLTAKEDFEYEDLQRKLPGLQDREKQQGPSFTEDVADAQARIKELQEDQHSALNPLIPGTADAGRAERDANEIAALQAKIDANAKYTADVKAAQEEIAKSVPKLQELNGAVDALKIKIEASNIGVNAAQTKITALDATQRKDVFTLDQKQGEDVARQTFTDAQAQRDAQKADLETKMKATMDVAQRGLIQEEIADLVAKGDTEKAGLDLKYGKIDQTQYKSAIKKASDVQQDARIEATQNDQRADVKVEDKQAEQLKAQISARPDHQALEPLVKAALALADPAQRVAELQSILAESVGKLANAHERLSGQVDKASERINALKTRMDQLDRRGKNNGLN